MSDTKIEWAEVPTHPGYFVNTIGQIRGPSGKILKPMAMKSGHLYVLTPKPRRPRKLFVHRAVLLTFKGSPMPGQEGRHLDGKPERNYIDNLEWGTRVEQREDERKHGTRCIGEKAGTAKLTEVAVAEIRHKIKTSTLRKLALEYGVSHTAIRRAANGKTWRYANG